MLPEERHRPIFAGLWSPRAAGVREGRRLLLLSIWLQCMTEETIQDLSTDKQAAATAAAVVPAAVPVVVPTAVPGDLRAAQPTDVPDPAAPGPSWTAAQIEQASRMSQAAGNGMAALFHAGAPGSVAACTPGALMPPQPNGGSAATLQVSQSHVIEAQPDAQAQPTVMAVTPGVTCVPAAANANANGSTSVAGNVRLVELKPPAVGASGESMVPGGASGAHAGAPAILLHSTHSTPFAEGLTTARWGAQASVESLGVCNPCHGSGSWFAPGNSILQISAGALPAAVRPDLRGLKLPTETDVDLPIVVLHQCKHIDRTTKRMQCPAPLHLRPHKRGYLAVACEAGHQWVWCAHCCDCGLGTRGCIMPAHWMERDSYDTGKRNHMQRHLSNEISPGQVCV